MINWLSRLGTNQRLALLALALGVGALFARPAPAGTVRVNPGDLAAGLARGGLVQPADLADWIIKGTSDFRLIDLRNEKGFLSYHVPGAENIQVSAIAESGIAHNERIVLCSDQATESAQAWFVLKAQGFKAVYILDRGMEGWTREVLFPTLKENASGAEQAENERRRQVSIHFGGTPTTGTGSSVADNRLPAVTPAVRIQPPTLPGGPAKAAPKKKKEGC